MGSSETDKASEPPKASAAQEQQLPTTGSAPTVYPDWPGFQAYSPIPPHGFFQSPVASSPQAHPYMWGAQHLMPPYGTPPPPYVMYPPGGLYAHPSIPPGSHPFSPYAMPSPNNNAEASGVAAGGAELDGKSSEGKDRSPIRRSKESLGSLNMITGKTNNELDKISGASANGGYSHSGESGSEGSSDSDANSQNGSQPKTSGGQDTFNGEQAAQNGTTARGSQNGVGHAPSHGMPNPTLAMMAMPAGGVPGGIAGPTTNLNIGLESWNAPARPMGPPIRGKVPAPGVIPSGMSGSRENIPAVLWQQDERELKRQRRKQANRESARRSRLRKQAECDELAQRVESLKEENTLLRAELDLIKKEHEQLLAQSTALKERLGEAPTLAVDQNSGYETQKHMDSNTHA